MASLLELINQSTGCSHMQSISSRISRCCFSQCDGLDNRLNKSWLGVCSRFSFGGPGFEHFSFDDLFADNEEAPDHPHSSQHQRQHFQSQAAGFGGGGFPDFQMPGFDFGSGLNVPNLDSMFGGNPHSAKSHNERHFAAHAHAHSSSSQGKLFLLLLWSLKWA